MVFLLRGVRVSAFSRCFRLFLLLAKNRLHGAKVDPTLSQLIEPLKKPSRQGKFTAFKFWGAMESGRLGLSCDSLFVLRCYGGW